MKDEGSEGGSRGKVETCTKEQESIRLRGEPFFNALR